MPDHRKKHQVFHVNLLKEWRDRPASSLQLWASTVTEEVESQEQFLPTTGEDQSVRDLSHLAADQQEELEAILPVELFNTKPGYTNLIQHEIRLRCPNQEPCQRHHFQNSSENYVCIKAGGGRHACHGCH